MDTTGEKLYFVRRGGYNLVAEIIILILTDILIRTNETIENFDCPEPFSYFRLTLVNQESIALFLFLSVNQMEKNRSTFGPTRSTYRD